MTAEELNKNYDFVIEQFYKSIDKIGREHFIFYDDGAIQYIWSHKVKSKEGK